MLNKTLFRKIIYLVIVNLSIPIYNNVVTNPERNDGFGAQFLTIIGCVIYAELNNIEFTYTPFSAMEHNYDNDQKFLKKKEWLINFIGNFVINDSKSTNNPKNIVDFFFDDKNLKRLESSKTLKKIRKIFRANKDHKRYFPDSHFNVAIHIRRPNPHDNRVDGTDTPDSVFLDLIHQLRLEYSEQKPTFHIYSQGEIGNFASFKANDVILHLNESIEDSFVSMIFADTLVTSRSTFSYCAALLSQGVVYYMPFCCAPLPNWKSIY